MYMVFVLLGCSQTHSATDAGDFSYLPVCETDWPEDVTTDSGITDTAG